jgi:hypothetical protein
VECVHESRLARRFRGVAEILSAGSPRARDEANRDGARSIRTPLRASPPTVRWPLRRGPPAVRALGRSTNLGGSVVDGDPPPVEARLGPHGPGPDDPLRRAGVAARPMASRGRGVPASVPRLRPARRGPAARTGPGRVDAPDACRGMGPGVRVPNHEGELRRRPRRARRAGEPSRSSSTPSTALRAGGAVDLPAVVAMPRARRPGGTASRRTWRTRGHRAPVLVDDLDTVVALDCAYAGAGSSASPSAISTSR